MATKWEVTSQNQRDELTDGGRFEPHMEINFRTIPEGIRGQVIVPVRLYNVDYVRSLIDPMVENMQAIQSL